MDKKFLRVLMGGLRSIITSPPVGTGGTVSARYCYSVYMRHRVIAAKYGMLASPKIVIELGPGDSLGMGLMAILTGAEKYIAIDAVKHASVETNLAVFDDLVLLLKDQAPIFYSGDCANIKPELDEYNFPYKLFGKDDFEYLLSPCRLSDIRRALSKPGDDDLIQYYAPLGRLDSIPTGSVDWIFSQAVMEHVDELEKTYEECFRCLKHGGIMSHQIDYQCHETALDWNGHWKYPQWLWILMRGRRPWFINRITHSAQVKLQKQVGFRIIAELLQKKQSAILRTELAPNFKLIPYQDMVTAGAMILSFKD